MSRKIILFLPVLVLLLTPAIVSAGCTDFIKHNDKEFNTDWDARAYAKIDISRVYGADCTDNPYKSYAKVRVRCQGDRLYMQRAPQDADWNNVDFNCDGDGCDGQSIGTGNQKVTLRNRDGDVRSVFFACWDYDKGFDGSWAYAWTGWAYWGDRSVGEKELVDADGDGIPDYKDDCPKTSANTPNGCPPNDQDADGVHDKNDACPDEAGSRPSGCPNILEQIVHVLFGWAGMSSWTL